MKGIKTYLTIVSGLIALAVVLAIVVWVTVAKLESSKKEINIQKELKTDFIIELEE